MPYIAGNGAIWAQRNTDEIPQQFASSLAGLADAKAQLVTGGAMQMPDVVALGTGWSNIGLVLFDASGNLYLSRFHIAGGADPTKRVHLICDSLTTATERTAEFMDWSGIVPLPIDLGASGRFLRSNGAGSQPSWEVVAVSNALLDGVNHTDTVAQACSQGSLILGNGSNLWDELVIGAANTVLTSNGTTAAWSLNPAVQHDTLAHLKPFQVAGNVRINNATDLLIDDTATNRFANVRIGDRINLDNASYSPTLFGMYALTSGVSNPNQIQVSRTNASGSNITGATATVYPGDHFDQTLFEGLMSSGGNGTYDEPTGGTEQTIRGSYAFESYTTGGEARWTFWGPTSTSKNAGFNIKRRGSAVRCYFHIENMATTRWVSMPNLTANDTFVFEGQAQSLGAKTLTLGCKAEVDGTTGRFYFQSGGGGDRILPDVSLVTAARNVKWPDFAGCYHVEGTPTTLSGATPAVTGSRTFKITNGGATNMTGTTGQVDGQEITLIFTNGNTTLKDTSTTGTFELPGSVDITPGANEVFRFVWVNADSKWYTVSRSQN